MADVEHEESGAPEGAVTLTLGVAALRLHLNHLRASVAVANALHAALPSPEAAHEWFEAHAAQLQEVAQLLDDLRNDTLLESADVEALLHTGDTHYDAGLARVTELAAALGVSAEDLLTVLLYS